MVERKSKKWIQYIIKFIMLCLLCTFFHLYVFSFFWHWNKQFS
jgi:hypothetical protein